MDFVISFYAIDLWHTSTGGSWLKIRMNVNAGKYALGFFCSAVCKKDRLPHHLPHHHQNGAINFQGKVLKPLIPIKVFSSNFQFYISTVFVTGERKPLR